MEWAKFISGLTGVDYTINSNRTWGSWLDIQSRMEKEKE